MKSDQSKSLVSSSSYDWKFTPGSSRLCEKVCTEKSKEKESISKASCICFEAFERWNGSTLRAFSNVRSVATSNRILLIISV